MTQRDGQFNDGNFQANGRDEQFNDGNDQTGQREGSFREQEDLRQTTTNLAFNEPVDGTELFLDQNSTISVPIDTPSIICNQSLISSISDPTECIINCNSSFSCFNTSIVSISSNITSINCISSNSCDAADIQILASDNLDPVLLNEFTEGISADILCNGTASCNNTTITCDAVTTCNLYCESPDSCLGTVLNGTEDINCYNYCNDTLIFHEIEAIANISDIVTTLDDITTTVIPTNTEIETPTAISTTDGVDIDKIALSTTVILNIGLTQFVGINNGEHAFVLSSMDSSYSWILLILGVVISFCVMMILLCLCRKINDMIQIKRHQQSMMKNYRQRQNSNNMEEIDDDQQTKCEKVDDCSIRDISEVSEQTLRLFRLI